MVSILITGAASGIGRALALQLAVPGAVLHLGDVAEAGLRETASQCRAKGASVADAIVDISDAAVTTAWVTGAGHLDLVLACAGVQFAPLNGEAESAAQTLRTFEVNLMGAMHTVLPAIEMMGRQPLAPNGMRGQIGIVASQGAFVAVPGASAYCASKAALDNWTVGRAALARRQGIFLTSICPGYVRTPMSAINGPDMQSLMEPEAAAAIILRDLAKRPVRIAFPFHMYLAARLGGLMPAGFPARMLARNHARRQGSSHGQSSQ